MKDRAITKQPTDGHQERALSHPGEIITNCLTENRVERAEQETRASRHSLEHIKVRIRLNWSNRRGKTPLTASKQGIGPLAHLVLQGGANRSPVVFRDGRVAVVRQLKAHHVRHAGLAEVPHQPQQPPVGRVRLQGIQG